MNIKESELEILLFYAFRYTLGRQTYAVDDVAKSLLKYKSVLSKSTKALICKEICMAVEEGCAGAEIDVKLWLDVYEKLLISKYPEIPHE